MASPLNRLVLDLKVTDNSPIGRAPLHLHRGTRNNPYFPLENYALSYGDNGDGTTTYGLLRLYTAAWADASLQPVYLARSVGTGGRILQVVLPYHRHSVKWGGFIQSATVETSVPLGHAGTSPLDNMTLPDFAADDDSGAAYPSSGSTSAYGGETTSIPLPQPTGDTPEPDAGAASGAAFAGAGLSAALAAAMVTAVIARH